jgi:hypothetical protein
MIRAPEAQKVVKESPVILDYARRIQEKFFPEYSVPQIE